LRTRLNVSIESNISDLYFVERSCHRVRKPSKHFLAWERMQTPPISKESRCCDARAPSETGSSKTCCSSMELNVQWKITRPCRPAMWEFSHLLSWNFSKRNVAKTWTISYRTATASRCDRCRQRWFSSTCHSITNMIPVQLHASCP